MFRTTAFAVSTQAVQFANRFNTNIAQYHRQISSGERLHRPSDEPVGFRQVISIQAQVEEMHADLYNVRDTESKLNNSVSQLTAAHDLLVTAKVLTQQAVQATSQTERDAIAIEVESLLRNLQEIAQTKSAGAYIYGGTKSDSKPFSFEGETVPGGTLDVRYLGSNLASQAFVGQSVTVKTFYSGAEVFRAAERQPTLMIGNTGAKPGRSTDNMIGRATLQVRHTLTTFEPGSGITAGTSSAAGDTIIGPAGAHQLNIVDTSGNGSSGTVSLNNGPPIPFTNSDTDLKVTGSDGNIVFVNMTSITAGFDGVVKLTGNGTLSVDGGATTVPIDFTDNQIVSVGSSGRMAHVDSSGIQRAGDNYLEFPGTSDAFQVLHELILDLRGSRELSSGQLAESLGRRLGNLEQISNQLLETVGNQSASLRTLQQLGERIEDFKLETELQLNEVQSTNVPETILKMKNDQTLLEYTYSVTASITSMQLINFLR